MRIVKRSQHSLWRVFWKKYILYITKMSTPLASDTPPFPSTGNWIGVHILFDFSFTWFCRHRLPFRFCALVRVLFILVIFFIISVHRWVLWRWTSFRMHSLALRVGGLLLSSAALSSLPESPPVFLSRCAQSSVDSLGLLHRLLLILPVLGQSGLTVSLVMISRWFPFCYFWLWNLRVLLPGMVISTQNQILPSPFLVCIQLQS